MAQSIWSRHEFTADDPPTETGDGPTGPGLGITKTPGVPSGDVLSVRLSGQTNSGGHHFGDVQPDVPHRKFTNVVTMNWLVVMLTPLKNDGARQLGWWNSQYMESHKSHVPNHQPVKVNDSHEFLSEEINHPIFRDVPWLKPMLARFFDVSWRVGAVGDVPDHQKPPVTTTRCSILFCRESGQHYSRLGESGLSLMATSGSPSSSNIKWWHRVQL